MRWESQRQKKDSSGYVRRADKKSQRTKAEKRAGEEGAGRVTKTKNKHECLFLFLANLGVEGIPVVPELASLSPTTALYSKFPQCSL